MLAKKEFLKEVLEQIQGEIASGEDQAQLAPLKKLEVLLKFFPATEYKAPSDVICPGAVARLKSLPHQIEALYFFVPQASPFILSWREQPLQILGLDAPLALTCMGKTRGERIQTDGAKPRTFEVIDFC